MGVTSAGCRAVRGVHPRCSRPVPAGEVFLALHLREAARRPLEFERQTLAAIELCRGCSGGDDQLDAAVVELIDEGYESARLVLTQSVHHGDIGDDDGLIVACDLDVVILTARAAAEGIELEPHGAVALAHHGYAAAFDFHGAVG